MRGFRSDMLRGIYREAVRQGFKPVTGRTSTGHCALKCPRCHYEESFSLTGRGNRHEVANAVANLRKHGFVWRGRGGRHTAPVLRPAARAGAASKDRKRIVT